MARSCACSPTCGWCSACWPTEPAADRDRWARRARATSSTEFNNGRPAGRPVGEVVDGMLAGRRRSLCPTVSIGRPRRARIRSSSISTAAAGCWATQQSDDPFCRDMCRRSGMIVVSVGYRHAPEHRFPAAAEDGYAATALDRRPRGRARRPAGAAAGRRLERRRQHRCRHLPARARPRRAGRSPASCWSARSPTAAFDRPSYIDNATGYFLTRSLMFWFWDLYCSPADRTDPRALAAARQTRGPAAGFRRDVPSSIPCATKASLTPRRWPRPACRSSSCRRAATSTPRSRWSTSWSPVSADASKMAKALRGFAGLPRKLEDVAPIAVNAAAGQRR